MQFVEDVDRFQFEVTENALMNESGSEVLDAFREAGFSLAIDDFGTGVYIDDIDAEFQSQLSASLAVCRA